MTTATKTYSNLFELQEERNNYWNELKENGKIDYFLSESINENNVKSVSDLCYSHQDVLLVYVNDITVEWCEGGEDPKECFKDGEKFTSLRDFQYEVLNKDLYFHHKYGNRGGYNKCKYTLRGYEFTIANKPSEVFEYTGRVDIGDGARYVNIIENVQNFITQQTDYKKVVFLF